MRAKEDGREIRLIHCHTTLVTSSLPDGMSAYKPPASPCRAIPATLDRLSSIPPSPNREGAGSPEEKSAFSHPLSVSSTPSPLPLRLSSIPPIRLCAPVAISEKPSESLRPAPAGRTPSKLPPAVAALITGQSAPTSGAAANIPTPAFTAENSLLMSSL
jgi:hypothetical protein